jgi:uncharacterized membrane protein YcaP (DUF421 family)
MESFEAFFGGQHPNIGQECARAGLIFVFGYLLLRFSGRRIFGRWSPLDILVSIIVGSNLSRAITGSAPLLGTMAATALLMALHWAMAKLSAHSQSAARLLEGSPVELGRAGTLDGSRMKGWSISQTDLDEAMRESKVKSLAEMQSVMLEPSGKIHVTKTEG